MSFRLVPKSVTLNDLERRNCQGYGELYSCGLGCWGGRHAIPWVPWAGPGIQSPVAVRYGAVWLGGAY